MKNRFIQSGIVTFLLTLVTAGSTAYAATGDFTLYPTYMHGENKSWILRKAQPGSSIQDFVTLENLTDKKISIQLGVQEAEETENNVFKITEDTSFAHVGLWTKLETSAIELMPKEKKQVKVTMNIPENTETNKTYMGTILAAQSTTNEQSVQIVTRIGVRIYLDVLPAGTLQTNIFNATPQHIFFFIFSLIGVFGAIFYNIIHYLEKKRV